MCNALFDLYPNSEHGLLFPGAHLGFAIPLTPTIATQFELPPVTVHDRDDRAMFVGPEQPTVRQSRAGSGT